MKGRAIFFCLVLTLAVALAGCSRDKAPTVTPDATPSHSPSTTPDRDDLYKDDGEYSADPDGTVEDDRNDITDSGTNHGGEDAMDRAENAADDVIDGAGDAIDDMIGGADRALRDVTGR